MRSKEAAFEGEDYKRQDEAFVADPYPLGIRENKKMLEILYRHCHEEGLTNKLTHVEDVFYRTTLDT